MIIFHELHRSFNGRPALYCPNLKIPDGSIACITGPSGSGKTTLLRTAAGLETADSGFIEGIDRNSTAVVFQEDRLCMHLSAVQNLNLIRPISDPARILCDLGLSESLTLPVSKLSGGMRRRVALARALVTDAKLLLLDEPFTGLDPDTKRIAIDRTLLYAKGRTVILVTHDRGEAEAMGADIRMELVPAK